MQSNRQILILILIAAVALVIISGCGVRQTATAESTATSTVAEEAPTEMPPTPTQIPPTETPEATATEIPPTSTTAPSATPQPTVLPEEIVDAHGVPMVLVPAGEFVMGADDDHVAAMPAHTVYLDTYYIDMYEVTQNRYRACLEAGGCSTEHGKNLNTPVWNEHPMMDVTWYDAMEYCGWRGGSLPTEAQWEKAARGTDGRRYPWGDEPVTCERARYGECGWMTAPVGSHPAGVSPYGAHDMAGNAWEFVYDWYDRDYYLETPYENPTGPEEDTGWKSERGGAWFYEADLMSSIWRNHLTPIQHFDYVGFRCVINP